VFALLLLASVVEAINNGLGKVPMRGWSTWCTSGPCFQVRAPWDASFFMLCFLQQLYCVMCCGVLSGCLRSSILLHVR
jgi:hypothetical protein